MRTPSTDGCALDAQGHCSTCRDEALVATVVAIGPDGWSATVQIDERRSEIDVSLVESVAIGEVLLVHAGVALGRARADAR